MRKYIISIFVFVFIAKASAERWSLQQCLDYAKEHSIDLKKSRISEQTAEETLYGSKGALLPKLTASTNQNVTNRPWAQSMTNIISDGSGSMTASSSANTISYTSNYGLNLTYTLWNGGKRTRTIEQNKLSIQQAQIQTEVKETSLKEQIMQLYVQTLYASEAITINEGTLKVAKAQRDRAQQMVKIGQLSKADLSQLEAQVAQDEYNVVNAQTSVAKYKLQLKQLLELPSDTEFDIGNIDVSDAAALQAIPAAADVYLNAASQRPELRNSQLAIDIADKGIEIAKTGKLPTVSLTAGIGTSNMTGSKQKNFAKQWKENFSSTAGLSVSVPIFSQHQNKMAVNKAVLQKQSAELDLESQRKTLRNTIDGYYLDAVNAQAQFRSASANVVSMQTSFDLLSEQFNVGLKNLVELMDGKNNLQKALQTKLQSKYTFILDEQLLKYYNGEALSL